MKGCWRMRNRIEGKLEALSVMSVVLSVTLLSVLLVSITCFNLENKGH